MIIQYTQSQTHFHRKFPRSSSSSDSTMTGWAREPLEWKLLVVVEVVPFVVVVVVVVVVVEMVAEVVGEVVSWYGGWLCEGDVTVGG